METGIVTMSAPEGYVSVELVKWLFGGVVSAMTAMGGFIMFIIGKFSKREETVIRDNTAAVENLAEVIAEQNTGISDVGEHLKTANQLAHDQQIIDADRLNRGG